MRGSQVDAGDEGIGMPGGVDEESNGEGIWGREAAVLQSGHRTTLMG